MMIESNMNQPFKKIIFVYIKMKKSAIIEDVALSA